MATFDALSKESDEIFVHLKSDTKDTETLVAELRNNPDVVCASPNYVVRASVTPSDPMYSKQWSFKRIGAEALWETTTGAKNIYVAVMDTGIDRTHSDLKDNIDTTWSRNFLATSVDVTEDDNYGDERGHGSHVSGIIGAVANNGTGMAGLNWDVNIIALKVLGDDGLGTTDHQIAALNHIVGMLTSNPNMKLPAVNMSYGGWHPIKPGDVTPQWMAYKALDRLNRTVMVVAAGNESLEVGAAAMFDIVEGNETVVATGSYCYPASYADLDNMIVVGSLEENDEASSFTNWSSKYVDIAAPGGDILSTISADSYERKSGTSMAAPHVAGAIALVASVHPEWTASELKSYVLGRASGSVNPLAPAKAGGKDVLPRHVTDTTVSRRGMLNLGAMLQPDSSRSGCAAGVAGPAGAAGVTLLCALAALSARSARRATRKKR